MKTRDIPEHDKERMAQRKASVCHFLTRAAKRSPKVTPKLARELRRAETELSELKNEIAEEYRNAGPRRKAY